MKLRPGGRQHNFPGICQCVSLTQAAAGAFSSGKKKKADKSIFRKMRSYRNHLTSPSKTTAGEEPCWCSACGPLLRLDLFHPRFVSSLCWPLRGCRDNCKAGQSGHGSKKESKLKQPVLSGRFDLVSACLWMARAGTKQKQTAGGAELRGFAPRDLMSPH